MSSLPQIGDVPLHALASPVVHCTHIFSPVSQTAVGAAHSVSELQPLGPVSGIGASIMTQLGSVGCPSQ
jgi:hypothetical protein